MVDQVHFFGEPSTGSNEDFARATDLARRMVCECGMSDGIGALAVPWSAAAGDGTAPPWSEATLAAIDGETKAIVAVAAERARRVPASNRRVVDALASALVAAESLEGDALHRCLAQVGAAEGEAVPQWPDLVLAP